MASTNIIVRLLRSIPQMKPVRHPTSKKQNNRLLIVLIMMMTCIIALLNPRFRFQLLTLFEYPIHYREYREFGIRIPTKYAVHGIDVSRYQEKIDFRKVKAMHINRVKIDFVFIKATEGTWLKDKYFERNWANARAAGLIRGAYHFYRPRVSARDQALHFIRHVSLHAGDLPPVLDVETEDGMSVQQIRSSCKVFLRILEKKYKVKPIIYTHSDFYKKVFAHQPDFDEYPFWIAHYHIADLQLPDNRRWHFWQHSDQGNVYGINPLVDFNVFRGDSLALRRLCLP